MLSVIESELPARYRDDAAGYWPAVENVVHHILRRLPVHYQDYVFVDAGCVKGRAMLTASMYPLPRIAGVELSPLTAETARRNVAIFRERAASLQRCADIDVICQDILDYDIPDANVVVFLYNPFQGLLFQSFMQRLHEASQRTPHREMLVVYHNPWSGDEWLRKTPYFSKIYEHRMIAHRLSWNVWTPVRG